MTDWRDWGDGYPPSGPLPADGLKARTKRGSIGEQWWSRRFIDVLESFGMEGRLGRGRRYARTGQVLHLTVGPSLVTASVQGSRPRPYTVEIEVDELDPEQWALVEAALADQALFRAKLLAGEMPLEIEDVFHDCGVPLFPERLDDLYMDCSCPDWGLPCKHLAAVFYLLAEAFDDDPFLVLAWRGRERAELLDRLRQLSGSAQGGPDQAAPDRPVIDVTDRPLADCLDDYWSPGMSLARLRTPPRVPATAPDLLLRTLAPPPIEVRRQDLVELLTPVYHQLHQPPSSRAAP